LHPAFLLLPIVCFVTALILVYSGYLTSDRRLLIAAAVAALGGLVGGVVALTQGGARLGRQLGVGQRLGRGPYVVVKLADNIPDILGRLFTTAEDMRSAAEDGEWEIDWPHCNNLQRAAEQARQAGQWQAAIREVTRLISFLLEQVRKQAARKASDSGIEY
jgi:hypothetical protein